MDSWDAKVGKIGQLNDGYTTGLVAFSRSVVVYIAELGDYKREQGPARTLRDAATVHNFFTHRHQENSCGS